MGSSCIKITNFVDLSRYFYQGVRLMLRWPKFATKNRRFSRLWTTSSSPNLGPSAMNLVYTYTKVAIWSISVVVHTCRVIYITSPAQNLKKLQNLPRTTPGNQNLLLEQQVPIQTSVQALRTLFAYRTR